MELFEDEGTPYIYTVSEITKEIKLLLESTIPSVIVKGEISNFTHHSSGHMYFSLKDKDATLRCVMFKYQNQYLRFRPESGMSIIATGNIKVYEPSGQYQLMVKSMQPAGIGELEIAFQQLKEKLSEEGLFDEIHKTPIPRFPERIGVVTSATGAAVRDIINVTKRRSPWVDIIVNSARVQGSGAAEEIASAIEEFNRYGDVDLLIVGRGGGSLEDLWCFNEEVVARAIFNSKIPVISAVGHQIDFTISDFVADLRAPTPSAAAELAIPDTNELLPALGNLKTQMTNMLLNYIESYKTKLENLKKSYGFKRPHDYVAQKTQRLDELEKSLHLAFNGKWENKKQKFEHLVSLLESLNPLSILKRGYSVTRKLPDETIIKSVSDVEKDDELQIRVSDGHINCSVIQK